MNQVVMETWKDASESAKHKRVDWARYLGMPMRRFVYIMQKEGKTPEQCLVEVKTKIWAVHGYITPRMETLALIGVSAGYSEGDTINKVKDMEEHIENLDEKKVEWSEIEDRGKATGKYLSVKPDVPYILTMKSADLYRDERWKDAQGQPKLKCRILLDTVNKEPANGQVWETGSFTVMKEINKAVRDGSLTRSSFLLKKKDTEGKVTYIFEKIGELSPSPYNPTGSVVGAFL